MAFENKHSLFCAHHFRSIKTFKQMFCPGLDKMWKVAFLVLWNSWSCWRILSHYCGHVVGIVLDAGDPPRFWLSMDGDRRIESGSYLSGGAPSSAVWCGGSSARSGWYMCGLAWYGPTEKTGRFFFSNVMTQFLGSCYLECFCFLWIHWLHLTAFFSGLIFTPLIQVSVFLVQLYNN